MPCPDVLAWEAPELPTLTRAQLVLDQHGAGARRDQRRGVQAHEARAERSVEDAQAQHVPAYFRAA